MKKSKLLILFPVMGLFLSGCTFQEGLQSTKSWISSHIYHPLKDFFSGSSTPAPSEEGKKEEEKKDEGKTFSFADWVTKYKEYGFNDVVIPDYKCASSEAAISQPDADYPNFYVIKGSSASEMNTYVASLKTAKWAVQAAPEEYGGQFAFFGDGSEGCPWIWVLDTTNESEAPESEKGITLQFLVYEPASSEFPSEEIATDFATLGYTDELPAFTGEAVGYTYVDSASSSSGTPQLQIMVAEGSEGSAIEQYQADLLAAGFTYSYTDEYGDKHYVSENEQYDVCAWDGTDIEYPGYVFVDIGAAE